MIYRLLPRKLIGYIQQSKTVFFVVLICLVIVSCKRPPVSSPTDEVSFSKVLYKRYNNNIKGVYCIEQVEIDFNDGDSKKFKANVYVHQGVYIYLNINVLGFELARIELSPDSVKIINRLEKTYYFESFKNFNIASKANLSYSNIESLILNGYVYDGVNNFKRFKESIIEDEKVYSLKKQIGGFVISSVFSKETLLEERIEISNYSIPFLLKADLLNYSENEFFPGRISIDLTKEDFKADIIIRLGKVQNHKPSNRSFTINSKYREMEL